MSIGLRNAWHVIWQPPARAVDMHARERTVGFLELFYDLVFVVIVAQLAHSLAADVSWVAFVWFAGLFYVVWSSWTNGTFYTDSHGTRDVSIRVFTLAQMVTLALMAAFVGRLPHGEGTVGFALAYGANCLILAVMWFRTGFHDPLHRPASYPYSAAYGLSAALLLGSSFADGSVFWVMLVVAVVLQALAFWRIARRVDRSHRIDVATPTIIERFGLLVILVLGEVVAGAVNGMVAAEHITAAIAFLGISGVLLAGSLWWLYFDTVSERRHRGGRGSAWVYGHFPLVAFIAAAGAGVLAVIESSTEYLHAPVRWLVTVTVAAAFVTISALTYTLGVSDTTWSRSRALRWSLFVMAVPIALLGFTHLEAVPVMVAVLALMLVPILVGIVTWLVALERGEIALDERPDSTTHA